MSEATDLAAFLERPGPWTYAYVDGHGNEPQAAERSRRRAVIDALQDAGAPAADIEEIGRALDEDGGLPSPSARYLLTRDGRIEVDERFAGPRLGPEVIGHDALPRVLPLVRHRAADLRYLVVETGRDGAELRVERAGRARVEATQHIEGRTDSLPKVQAGGWSHLKYQQHSEEIWSRNQAEVADAVERIVRERRPRFVVIGGDVRARQLLQDQLGPATRDLVVEVDAHTRAPGSDGASVDDAVAEAVEAAVRGELDAVVARASAGDGAAGARGTGEVVAALQQARVDTLVLDARLLDATETLDALDGPPMGGRRLRGGRGCHADRGAAAGRGAGPRGAALGRAGARRGRGGRRAGCAPFRPRDAGTARGAALGRRVGVRLTHAGAVGVKSLVRGCPR